MEHLALYRKYRPSTFEEVVGQEHITKALANQVMLGKISHAYLFTGSRGMEAQYNVYKEQIEKALNED